jgi:hypothetical protein
MVGVGITAEDGSVVAEVHKRVEKVSDLVSREIGGLVVASIDTPFSIRLVLLDQVQDKSGGFCTHQLTK